jgi:hypothetical protein
LPTRERLTWEPDTGVHHRVTAKHSAKLRKRLGVTPGQFARLEVCGSAVARRKQGQPRVSEAGARFRRLLVEAEPNPRPKRKGR